MYRLCLFFTLLITTNAWSINPPIGEIKALRGTVTINKMKKKIGDKIFEGDILKTKKKSFIKALMIDNTHIVLGQNSKIVFKSYHKSKKKRVHVVNFLKGKIRVLVKEKAKKGEVLQFNNRQVALGVRGTEFLTNIYKAKSGVTSDVLLIEGKMKVTGKGVKSFILKPKQYFNSSDLLKNGATAVKKASTGMLKALKSGDFLPKLMQNGKLINLSKSLGVPVAQSAVLAGATAVAGAAGLLGALVGSDEEKDEDKAKEKPVKKEKAPKYNVMVEVTSTSNQAPMPKKVIKVKKVKKRKKKSNTKIQGVLKFKYKLTEEPQDIRETIRNDKRNRKKNQCYYFIYKKIPGAGEKERFRRERDCDEYNYDL